MQGNPTKIALSPDELNLVTNAQILLTKNQIIQKVQQFFGHLSTNFVDKAAGLLHGEISAVQSKISRGENYLGLPYVVLDYPRVFEKENTLAIRTFFWWGNFFSITLQLKGALKSKYQALLQDLINNGQFSGWYINSTNEEWQHHFEPANYQPVETSTNIIERDVIKLATKIPLNEWDDAEVFLSDKFSMLLSALQS